ncbi:MAG: hypothetical protein B7Y36_01540 [Novosphingobium sp. 28-62-57]|uniref:MASE1 domain-containing protein n=1 Tax=unclassified Novosphingobium TaxID=2644732 RepID=UPI000BD0E707|nr:MULTISPECIES: MASE1 domain-containing protein [unclassified Novosphingobium]OYW49793.1 MAG: hypothetical protein B7Z34_09070 [Novosphingobium sp. 12-62-10]OYZ12251.1 MAG: hypothetical protein B7Y36_01540 [Novosphingobium sp. 28-62-57]OZA35729.1 MAG: hypothetical protein B7X92_09260 [Novosphingobium sp. 17-62-9]HQS69591.1 MASE1 domain-containing protein [Novosphingobium sp.]
MRSARLLAGPVGVSLTYFVLAAAAVTFGRFTGGVAMAWMASAMLAGRLLHLPRRRWTPWVIGCILASTVATGFLGLGWLAAVPFALVNVAEAGAAALLWQRITRSFWPHDTLEWVASFYIGIGLMVPLLSGAAATFFAWVLLDQPLVENFSRWIIGHALGFLACLPVFHFIYGRLGRGKSFLPPSSMRPMATLIVVTFTSLTVAVFLLDMRALLVFPMIYLVVSAATLPGAIVTLLPLLLILIGGGLTVSGYGPIAQMDLPAGDRLQFFQLYVGVTVLAALPLSCERTKRLVELRKMRSRIAELERERPQY